MTTTALSFEELFRLAFEEPVTWLSAESSKRGSVNWVVTSLSDVQDGDILLLNGEQIDVDVLTQAKESNVGCVLILGDLESRIENLPENYQSDRPYTILSRHQHLHPTPSRYITNA